jgi:hypothetical protein
MDIFKSIENDRTSKDVCSNPEEWSKEHDE